MPLNRKYIVAPLLLLTVFVFFLPKNTASSICKCRDSSAPLIINFSTKNGAFTFDCYPTMGRDAEMMERVFSDFKEKHPMKSKLKIYRTTKKCWCNMSNWDDYIFAKEWSYPYINLAM